MERTGIPAVPAILHQRRPRRRGEPPLIVEAQEGQDGFARALVDRNSASMPALRPLARNIEMLAHLAAADHVVDIEPGQLADPQRGVGEQHNHGAIPHAERFPGIDRLEDLDQLFSLWDNHLGTPLIFLEPSGRPPPPGPSPGGSPCSAAGDNPVRRGLIVTLFPPGRGRPSRVGSPRSFRSGVPFTAALGSVTLPHRLATARGWRRRPSGPSSEKPPSVDESRSRAPGSPKQ